MNFLAHARDCLDRPWVLAGTVLPDWIRIVAPASRIRPFHLDGLDAADGPVRSEVVEGLRRHFADNEWFHASPAFREATAAITAGIRASFPGRVARPSFFAHLLVEMLLDAWLLETRSGAGPAFLAAVRSLDPAEVEREAGAVAPGSVAGLAALVPRFRAGGVLAGYLDDAEVVRRLDRTGARVRQPPLPEGFARVVAAARLRVYESGASLLAAPD